MEHLCIETWEWKCGNMGVWLVLCIPLTLVISGGALENADSFVFLKPCVCFIL